MLCVEELTIGQAAALVGVSRSTLLYAAKTGNLPAKRVGRYFVVTETDVRRWLRSPSHVPTRAPREQWKHRRRVAALAQ